MKLETSFMTPLTESISGDEYVRVVLIGRQNAWFDAHPDANRATPPLLEWFILESDEEFVTLPEGY